MQAIFRLAILAHHPGRDLERIEAAVCDVGVVLYVLIWHLMGSAGCSAARLKSQSAKLTACCKIGAVICSSLGRRSARELGSTSCPVGAGLATPV